MRVLVNFPNGTSAVMDLTPKELKYFMSIAEKLNFKATVDKK